MSELDEVVLLGDGVLVEKPVISNEVNGLHLPEGYVENELPVYECLVVKVGPGDQKEMSIKVNDIAVLPKMGHGQGYAEMKFDGKVFFIIAQHNILFVKRKDQ